MAPQTQRVYDLLANGHRLTRVIAMHYGIMNLTARLADLRNMGYRIHCVTKRDMDGNRYGEFHLVNA